MDQSHCLQRAPKSALETLGERRRRLSEERQSAQLSTKPGGFEIVPNGVFDRILAFLSGALVTTAASYLLIVVVVILSLVYYYLWAF